jgi:hypothetical protein
MEEYVFYIYKRNKNAEQESAQIVRRRDHLRKIGLDGKIALKTILIELFNKMYITLY